MKNESYKMLHQPSFSAILPILPLQGVVSFPLTNISVAINKDYYRQLIEGNKHKNQPLLLVLQKEGASANNSTNIFHIGTLAAVEQIEQQNDGAIQLLARGKERVRLLDFVTTEPFLSAHFQPIPDKLPSPEIAQILQLVYLTASTIGLSAKAQQEILELDALEEKIKKLINFMQKKFPDAVFDAKPEFNFYLHERTDLIELRQQVEAAKLQNSIKHEALRELERISNIPIASPEYRIIYAYLEWLTALPWNNLTGGTIDLQHARKILDEDHYDLDKIKDRIIEHLAVKKLREERQPAKDILCIDVIKQKYNPNLRLTQGEPAPNIKVETPMDLAAREPVLCLVGPSGVGKTSLGQSIARALGRKFLRISLGGLRDEAEIRGQRRSSIGALPGRIIQGIRQAGVCDPIIMFDEIDKMSVDLREDHFSALLEALDPAQNTHFVDQYLNVGFDLSQVLFIATANTLENIPTPILNLMEVLHLSGYTDEEKLRIAQMYLIPKQRSTHGLTENDIQFDEDALQHIIRGYTREAGVRNLGHKIATICRKVARKIAEGQATTMRITTKTASELLGPTLYFDEVAERTTRPGVATGLVWTSAGGEILFIEATTMPSKSERLLLTGLLGEIMTESAQAALSFIRSNLKELNIDPKSLEDQTIHIHMPDGAISKDGPSAGLALTVALASLLTGRLVRNDIAMTGEITLRGKVLQVGGVKEKILAAYRAGIKTIILPKRNQHDLEEVAIELREKLNFIFVESIEEVLPLALEPKHIDLVLPH